MEVDMLLEVFEEAARRQETLLAGSRTAGVALVYCAEELDDRLVREHPDGRREFIAYPPPVYALQVLGEAPPRRV